MKPVSRGILQTTRKPERGMALPERGDGWSSIVSFADPRIRPPAHPHPAMSSLFLTPQEVYERYRGMISLGTLRNWRMMKIGPSFLKLGRAVLYPLSELEAWDRKNLGVICRAAKGLSEKDREAAG